jgi:adenylate cyclase
VTRSTIQRLRLLALLVATSAAAGSVYSITQRPPDVSWLQPATTGAIIGGVISSCIIGFELFGASRLFERGGSRLPLTVAVLLRTAVYGVVITAALLVFPWLIFGAPPSLFRQGMLSDVVFSFTASFAFFTLMSIIQLIGPSVLGNLLVGRYYHPREEERIILFLDLAGSTGMAERLGNVRFHALLSETFTSLSRVVTDFGGEVYRYVGDALIATWPVGSPEQNVRSVRCLFACRDALEAARSDLLRRYEHVPEFRAGLHAGLLVAGEVGGFKREIALLGDAMNTAARLEQACRTTGHALLASKPLLDRTLMPPDIVATSIGSPLLRGKAERLELFALERDTQDRAMRLESSTGVLAEGGVAAASGSALARSLILNSRD